MLDQSTDHHGSRAELQALDQALAVIVFAANGTILRANANFLHLVDHKVRELMGQPRTMFVPRRQSDVEADAILWESVCRGATREAECPLLRKDGSVAWIRASYTCIADAQGGLAEVVLFAADITDAKRRAADDHGQIVAINASQGVVHFALNGDITDANERFLQMVGYRLDEVVGQHHRLFVDPADAQCADHQQFWQALIHGQPQAGIYQRIGSGRRKVWLHASYNPIVDMNGRVSKIVQYATDITADKLRRADHEGQIDAIDQSHGVITFDMNGTVLGANDAFLRAVGYRLEEVAGRHHRMFVDPSYAHGPEYAAFWNNLAEGRHQAGECRRIGKNGREVWLQASYNPIRDLNGRLCKVVTYATDITREQLRRADHQGQIASIHKAQCVVSFALDGTVIDANDNFLDATGYRLAEVRGRHHRMFVDDETSRSDDYLAFWRDLAQGQYKAAEFKRLCKDGREIWLQASYNPIFDMSGRPFKVVKYATDVTRDRLRQIDNEGRLDAIDKSQCVVVFDMNGLILQANDNFLAAMGYDLDELEGRHHDLFVEPAYARSDEYRAFWDTLRAGNFLSDKFLRIGKGGKKVWIQASYNPILDLNGRPSKVVKYATDVTADVAMAADFVDAHRRAYHDAATKLPNRVGLIQFLTAKLGHAGDRLALLFLDLDHFKPINDTYGHHVGDLVLRETARRLTEAIDSDQMAARVGGDEFVVAAPNLSDAQTDALCQRLIDAVSTPIPHEDCTLTVGLSIGVAVSPQDAASAEELLRCADVALYRTKGNGRGGYSYFATEMDERLCANRHLAEEMRHGIKAGQFYLDYQPRFDVHTGELHNVEAQLRWAHPTRGRLEPPEFIEIAELSGLIVPLGEYALRLACQTAARLSGIDVSVSVAPTQFTGTDLPKTVAAVLAESGLPPQHLELDVAESMLIDNAPRARAALEAIKALGVRLNLQGYGAHHTTLDSLRAFAIDTVRIDRRYIADLEAEADGRRIVRDIARTAQALHGAPWSQKRMATGEMLTLGLDDRAAVQGFVLATACSADALSALWLQRTSAASAPVNSSDTSTAPAPSLRPTVRAAVAETN